MLKIIQDSEKYFILTCAKGENNMEAISKTPYTPSTITKLRHYLDFLLPNGKRGNLNLGIRIAFNGYWSTI